MTVSALSPLSLNTIFDISGMPIRPARLFFLQAQTQSPLIVYQDALLSVAHQQPVVTTGNGRVPVIFVGESAYRVRIFDEAGMLIEDIDNIPGAIAPSDGGGGGGGGTIDPGDPRLIATGDMIAAYSVSLRAGFVRANGYTIGSASSGASERANADCQALFTWLWNQDTGLMLPIPGGRGTSAVGDWNANKQITLPDFRARSLFGVDGMGAPNTSRLNGAVFDTGDATKIGAGGGRATHALTLAQLAAHNHGASGWSDVIGAHAHSVTTYAVGDHVHSVPQGGGGTTQAAGATVGTIPTLSAQTTGPAGSHSHTGYTDTQGVHQHALTVNIANSGSNGEHPQAPPFQTATVFIKL
jgi:hypothetical protein